MDRVSVSSSRLQSVGYDPDTETLEIQFESGSVYRYEKVPREVHDGLMRACSKGKYFLTRIHDRYPKRRVQDDQGYV